MCLALKKAILMFISAMLIFGVSICFAADEGEILFQDDFEDPNKSSVAWNRVDSGGDPVWSFDSGVATVKFNSPGYQFTWILAGERTWDNYQLEAKVKAVKGSMNVGLIARSAADKSLT